MAEVCGIILKDVTSLITTNQACGDCWILSDAVNDFLKVYINVSNGMVKFHPEVVTLNKRLMDQHDNSKEVLEFVPHLIQLCVNMCNLVWNNLKKWIEPFVSTCTKPKARMFFLLILDPQYLQLTTILQLHKIETYDSNFYFTHMMELFLVHVVAAEGRKIHRK